ncbi:hypothetical protein [Streptomyces wuyuanensis]
MGANQWSTGLRTALGRRTGRFSLSADVCSLTFFRGFWTWRAEPVAG